VIQKTPLTDKILNGLENPRGVEVNQKGDIFMYVAEKVRGGYHISIFTKDNESFGSSPEVFGWMLMAI
jgi:hypothetical protein